MIEDSTLAFYVNTLGIVIMLLVVLYHYLAVNAPVKPSSN